VPSRRRGPLVQEPGRYEGLTLGQNSPLVLWEYIPLLRTLSVPKGISRTLGKSTVEASMPTQAANDRNESANHARAPEVVDVPPTVNAPRKSWSSNFFALLADKYREARASSGQKSQKLSWPAGSFILLQVVIGLPLLPYALLHWHPESELRFACFFGVALLSLYLLGLRGWQLFGAVVLAGSLLTVVLTGPLHRIAPPRLEPYRPPPWKENKFATLFPHERVGSDKPKETGQPGDEPPKLS